MVGESDLLAVHLHAGDVRADEASGAAGGRGVVELGHDGGCGGPSTFAIVKTELHRRRQLINILQNSQKLLSHSLFQLRRNFFHGASKKRNEQSTPQ